MAKKVTKNQEKVALTPAKQQALKSWNTGFALLFAVQAGAMVAFGGKITESITVRYLSVDQLATAASGHQALAVATRHLFDVRAAWVAALFLFIFAVVHLITASSYESTYIDGLKQGVGKTRWIALGLGGGAMFAAIALLSGLNDVVSLGLVWGAVLVAALAGLAVESLGADRPGLHRLLRIISGVGLLSVWLALAGSALAAAMYGGHVPGYLWGIYASTFIFSVALVMATLFRSKQRGQWANTVYTEKMYMLLGLASASLLAWQIFAGVR